MRSPNQIQAANLESQSNINILETTELQITAETSASKTKTKAPKPPTYRPFLRPDGVIIESPRYTPSPSPSPKPSPNFEPKPFEIPIPPSKPISRRRQLQQLRERNLLEIRNLGHALGRDGYNGTGAVECGRGGYNGPMDRFLREEGPWTTFSVQTGV